MSLNESAFSLQFSPNWLALKLSILVYRCNRLHCLLFFLYQIVAIWFTQWSRSILALISQLLKITQLFPFQISRFISLSNAILFKPLKHFIEAVCLWAEGIVSMFFHFRFFELLNQNGHSDEKLMDAICGLRNRKQWILVEDFYRRANFVGKTPLNCITIKRFLIFVVACICICLSLASIEKSLKQQLRNSLRISMPQNCPFELSSSCNQL